MPNITIDDDLRPRYDIINTMKEELLIAVNLYVTMPPEKIASLTELDTTIKQLLFKIKLESEYLSLEEKKG